MIKIIITLIIFIPIAYGVPSPHSRSGIENGLDLRLLKAIDQFVLTTEAKARNELSDRDYFSILLGSYYRFNNKFRLGLFSQAEQGLLWEESWKKKNKWKWDQDYTWDYSTVIDATYSNKFSSNLIWEVKNRIHYYHEKERLLWKLRPALKYFFIEDGRPSWVTYSMVEIYTPINYGKRTVYEYWFYNGILKQFTDEFSLGPVISWRQRFLHSYDGFKKKWGKEYSREFNSIYLGISATYSW